MPILPLRQLLAATEATSDFKQTKRSFADVVNDELKEGGRLAGADRGAVNDAMRRIRDLIPKIEGANKEDVKVSEWKPTDAETWTFLSLP